MMRRHPFVTALATVAVLCVGLIATLTWRAPQERRDGEGAALVPVVAAGPGACTPSPTVLRDATPPLVVPPAPVTVPGAVEIDTRGYVVTDLVSSGGQVWADVVEPDASPTAPVALAARVDEGAASITSVTAVAEGCSLSALAVGEGGVWAATCDEIAAPGTPEGGQVARIDPATGAVISRSPLPTRCLGDLVVAPDAVTAADFAVSGEPQRVYRVDPATGAVTQTQDLGTSGLGGVAGTDAGVWTEVLDADGDEAVLSDPVTGQVEVSVAEDDAVVVGGTGDTLWLHRSTSSVIVQRDAATGAVRSETPVADLQGVAAGPSGAWFQQASLGSSSVTIGRVDPTTGAIAETFAFTGVGPDRSGLPFLGTLAVDESGAWLIYQGRLFRFTVTPAAISADTTTTTTTTTPAPPSSASPETTVVPTSTPTTVAPTADG